MAAIPHPRLTVSRGLYLELLQQNPDVRIERARDGTLFVTARNGGLASQRNAQIICQLGNWSKVSDGVVFDWSAGFDLPDGATLAPDVAWLPGPRWRALSPDTQRGFVPLAPDFVIEQFSPVKSLPETHAKLAAFIANGTRLAWLIDAERQVIEIHRPCQTVEVLDNPATVDGEDVLPRFILDLSSIFAR